MRFCKCTFTQCLSFSWDKWYVYTCALLIKRHHWNKMGNSCSAKATFCLEPKVKGKLNFTFICSKCILYYIVYILLDMNYVIMSEVCPWTEWKNIMHMHFKKKNPFLPGCFEEVEMPCLFIFFLKRKACFNITIVYRVRFIFFCFSVLVLI